MATEVEVELSEQDVRAGLVHTVLRHTPGIKAMPLMYLGALAALIGCIVWFAGGHRPRMMELVFTALCGGYLIGVPLLLREFARRSLQGGAKARYVFDSERLEIRIGRERVDVAWTQVFEVSETKRAFYVHPKPGIFHVLPKRALSNVEEFRASYQNVPKRSKTFEIYTWLSPSLMFSLMLIAAALVAGWAFE